MMSQMLPRLILTMTLLVAAAVGAVASAAPRSQSLEPAQDVQPARVDLIHAAPFAPGDAKVTIKASAGDTSLTLVQGFGFGERTGYLNLPAGSYEVAIFVEPTAPTAIAVDTPVFTATLAIVSGQDYTVIATGGGNGYPLGALVLNDTTPAFEENNGLVRFVHAAPFAANPDDTRVQVREVTSNTVLPGTLIFNQATDFFNLPASPYNLQIETATEPPNRVLGPLPLVVSPNSITTVVAIGGANEQAPVVVVAPFVERAPAMVRVVHAAPFEAGPATASAVISPILGGGGSLPLLGVNYRAVSSYVEVPAGGYNFKLYPGPTLTGTVALDTNLFFADGAKLTVVAIGTNTEAYPLALTILQDQQSPAPAGSASVRIFHAAPFGTTADQTGVDVVAQDGSAINPPVNGLFYGENTGYVNLPSEVAIDLKVVPTGLPGPTLIDLPVLRLGPTGAFTAIAIGGAAGIADKPPEVLLLTDLDPTYLTYLSLVAT